MNILITGAAGFIGSHLAEFCLKEGHKVIAIDNFNDFYDPSLKRKNLEDIKKTAEESGSYFQCYSGDICDTDMVENALQENQIELIVHLAAMAGVRPSTQKPLLYERVNGLGTLTLLEASRHAGIKNFVFGSSSSVYGLNQKVPFSETDPVEQPYSPYAQTKRANELQCYIYHQLYDMSFACLRFFTVYGPRQRPDLAIRKFTDLIYNNKPIEIYGDGSFKRDFTYVDDIIDGIQKSIQWVQKKDKQFEIFNLGESETTTVLELIDLIEKASGKKAERIFKEKVAGDVPITYADITKSKSVLGYNPQTKLEEGIPKFIKWYEKICA